MSASNHWSWRDRLARAHFWRWLAPGGNFVGVVCGLVGVVTDLFSPGWRVAIALGGLSIWAAASVGASLVARVQRQDELEIGALRARLANAGLNDRDLPDHALRLLAPIVFRPGTSWRLTLFSLEEDDKGWFLRPRLRCASSEMFESDGRTRIPLDGSVLREIKGLELPASGELSDAPDREVDFDDWASWQGAFIDDPVVIQALRMPTRKYAWCAARQAGKGGRTITLVAETVQPAGIKADVLSSSLLPPILEMTLRLIDLPEAAALDP